MASATARLPVPSLQLLRFLRSQTENASFFNSNLGPGKTSRRVLSTSRKLSRYLPSSTGCPLSAKEHTPLQAGVFVLDSLSPSRTSRTLNSSRPKQLPLVATTIGARHKSTDTPTESCKQSFKDRLLGYGTRKKADPLKPGDLPDHDGNSENNSMFNKRRQLSRQAALDPYLQCTELGESGKCVMLEGRFKKTELIAKFGLLPRDLRKIDSSNLPHILVRPTSILINLLHLKVLIMYNRVLLFDITGSKTTHTQSKFMYELEHKLQQKASSSNGGLPYEFRAVEAVLQSVTQELESEWEAVRAPVDSLLTELEDDIDRHKLRLLLIMSKKVSTFEQKARLVRTALDELLEADDDLAAMYLTEKTHDIYREQDDHTEIEMLLESYHKLCDEIAQEAENLESSIRNTEEIARAILDANRNSLMLLELKFSVGTLGLAMGTFIAGLYGMNLENFIEETNWGFGAVTVVSTLLSLWVCAYGLRTLRRVQRMKMLGNERKTIDPRTKEKQIRLWQEKKQIEEQTAAKKWWRWIWPRDG